MTHFTARNLLLLLALFCLTGLTTAQAENAVRFSNATAQAGEQVTVDIIVDNDDALGGLYIPFRWSSSDLTLDSIHFVRDRYQGVVRALADPASLTGRVGAILIIRGIPDPGSIDPGSGPVARLHFAVAPGALSQYITVDTVLEKIGNVLIRFANFSNLDGTQTIYPNPYPGTITIGDPGGIASITAIPERLDFVGATSLPSVPAQTIAVRSIDGPPFTWTISKSASWLGVLPVGGETPGQCVASVDLSSLDPGAYDDTITIASVQAVNSPVRIPVTLRVESGTALTVVPDHLEFHMMEKSRDPDNQTIHVASSNAVLLTWRARWTARWFLMEVATGSQSRNVAVGVRTAGAGLTVGQYTDTLTFTATGASNSPLKIPVSLVIDSITSPPPDSNTALSQNQPNPFSMRHSPDTRIVYSIAKPGKVEITILDILGRRVRTLVSDNLPAGPQEVRWDGRDDDGHMAASGHYFYRLTTGGRTITRQMVLIK